MIFFDDHYILKKMKHSENVDKWLQFEISWWLCLQAANYLDIKGLLDATCKTVANMIKGKTPEEIRKTFNIKNDFSPVEEEQVRKIFHLTPHLSLIKIYKI